MPPFKKIPLLKVLLLVWLIFTSLYVLYNEYKHLKSFVAQSAYNQGIQDSINQLLNEAAKCQPIPVSVGDRHAQLISLECLKTSDENSKVPAK